MDVRRVPLTALHPDPQNARRHNARNLDAIKASLAAFGQQKPLVVTADGVILAGNGTWEAARALHWTEIDVTYTTLDDAPGRAYSVADNRTAELAVWDEGELKAALEGLQAAGQPLIGWEAQELAALTGVPTPALQDVAPQLDRAEALREQWGVEPGQLWQLGRHRVLCGDCTEQEQVARLLAGATAAAVVADPPYGMAWDNRISGGRNGHSPGLRSQNFGKTIMRDTQPFDPAPWLDYPEVILWGANHYAARLPVGTTLVWIKRNDAAFGSFLSDAEIAWQKGGHGVYCHKNLSLYAEASERVHLTQKPVGLLSWCLTRVKSVTILDPYCGSGTTLIACEQLGRQCYGMEIAPAYVAVTLQRWADLTSQTPRRLE